MIERLARVLFLPTVVFGFAFLTEPYHQGLPKAAQALFVIGPYWAFGLVAALALAFNRGRTVLASLMLGLILLVSEYPDKPGQAIPGGTSVLLVLVSLGLVCLTFLRERGAFTQAGLLRLLVMAIPFGLLVLYPSESGRYIDQWLLPEYLLSPGYAAVIRVSQLAFSISVALLGLGLTISVLRTQPITMSLFASQFGVCVILWFGFDAQLLATFMLACAILLANGLLQDYYNMAYRDELTNLPQRRALNEQLASLGNRYTLAMLDVDHFKQFNDTHGHDIGDQVLQMVAAQIRRVGGGGKAYRYGGEEFTVVFAGKDTDDATCFLEQVRKSIAEYEMVIREAERIDEDSAIKGDRKRGSYRKAEKKVSVTISIGVAQKNQRGEQPEEVLKRADLALYRAKEAGRNQTCH